MERILFVDDEIAILEGLRNVFRGERGRWAMSFAEGAQAALDLLREHEFDVIVTDMRMPGMDGLDLLREVRGAYPRIVRVMLSGYTDLDRAAEASAVAHAMLMKPCEASAVRGVIERALRVQALLAKDELRGIVCGTGALPSAPRMYQALTAALGDPDSDAKKIAAIVQRDVAMAARVLKFANSAYFGFVQRVTSLEAAVVSLGVSAVRHLALTFEVFGAFPGAGGALDGLEAHSFLTARIARKMLPSRAEAETAFAAGLLHDIGKLVLMSKPSAALGAAIRDARRRQVPDEAEEAEFLGVTHAEVGAYLLGLWDLPHTIVDPVALHHARAPGRAGGDVADAIALANLLAQEQETGPSSAEQLAQLEQVPDIQRWREVAARATEAQRC